MNQCKNIQLLTGKVALLMHYKMDVPLPTKLPDVRLILLFLIVATWWYWNNPSQLLH